MKTVGLCTSVRMTGAMILHTYDFAKKLRDLAPVVVSRFWTPMEKEILRTLHYRATDDRCRTEPVAFTAPKCMQVWPHGVPVHLPNAVRVASQFGLYEATSPFATKQRARAANHLAAIHQVVALSDVIVVPAWQDGENKEFAALLAACAAPKPVYTLDAPENEWLIKQHNFMPITSMEDFASTNTSNPQQLEFDYDCHHSPEDAALGSTVALDV